MYFSISRPELPPYMTPAEVEVLFSP